LEGALTDAGWKKSRPDADKKGSWHWWTTEGGKLTVYADGHVFVHAPAGPLEKLSYTATELIEALDDAPPEWPEPSPLRSEAQLPTFPVDELPSWLAAFVRALARSTQTPLDLCAVMALGAISAVAGGRAQVVIRPEWTEPLNLYVTAALLSGERKSAVVAAVSRPIWAFEKEQAGPVEAERALAEASLDTAKKMRNTATTTLATAKAEKRAEAEAALKAAVDMVESIKVPALPRQLADDATPEALVRLMAEHDGRMAVLSPEGGDVFELIGGRYNKEPNFGIYLKSHTGEPYRTDRLGRPSEFIERPALTLALAIQPSVLGSIARMAGARGRGLLARFLYSLPASRVGQRDAEPPPMDPIIGHTYDQQMTGLLKALCDWDDVDLTLTPEARSVVVEYSRTVEGRLTLDGEYELMKDWGNKLVGASVRVAGLLHVAEQGASAYRTPIDADAVRSGRAIGEYFSAHAKAVFLVMGADAGLDDAEAVLRWVENEGHKSFTKRDAWVAHRSRFPKADNVDRPLALLEDAGWIRRHPDPPRRGGRPASPSYDVNPRKYAHNAHNAHNAPEE
jgi:hypothetical protein